MSHVRDILAERWPKKAERALKSRSAAVELFCVECFGGDAHDARQCENRACWLWPHAFKTQRRRLGSSGSERDAS